MKKPKQAKQQSMLQWETLEPRILLSAGTEALLVDNSIFEQNINQSETVLVLNQNDLSNTDQTQNSIITTTELVIIDSDTPNFDLLLNDIQRQSDQQLEILVLDTTKDGIEQINTFLNQYDNVSALHFISHGSDGNVNLGNTKLNVNTLSDYSDDLQSWQEQLTEDADILIYGCDVAETENGKDFIDILSVLTGADVAASDDLTGHESKGGDWDLEYQRGSIEAGVAVSLEAQQNWKEVLANNAPTGSVNIVGLPIANQTLTATNNLADEDGIGTFTYQWKFNGFDWPGANAATFDIPSFFGGAVVSVTISYTDDAGNSESVSSTSVGINSDGHTGEVSISGIAEENNILEISHTINDPEVIDAPSISYNWVRHGATTAEDDVIFYTTSNQYTLTDSDVGYKISAFILYQDVNGNFEAEFSAKTVVVTNVNDVPTGSVTISGSAIENETLSATNDLADEDGLGVLEYQWQRNGNPISGATAINYTLTDADVGATMTVSISYTDAHETKETITSAATLAVSNINDVPTSINNTVTTNEDTTYTFVAGDFNFADDDVDAVFTKIQITTLESNGSLLLNGIDVTTGQEIDVSDITTGKLTFQPAANDNGTGYDSFTFKVHDGFVYSDLSYSMTIDVTAVNDAPTASNNTITTSEDTTYTFTAGDFNFADVIETGDTLAKIQITKLEGVGPLQFEGSKVTLNQVISVADIIAGKLTFVPVANGNGNGHDSFEFKVNDGLDYSDSAYSMTIDITAVNDAPTGSVTISGSVTEDQTLTAENTLADADGLGALTYQWLRNGNPISGATNNTYILTDADVGALMTVTVKYNDGYGTAESVTSVATAAVANINDTPVAAADNLTAIEDTAMVINELTDLLANDTDIDGDVLSITSFSQPSNGTLVDNGDGTYTYTPNSNFSGNDSFTTTVSDGKGGTDTVGVTVSVSNINDAPLSVDQSYELNTLINDQVVGSFIATDPDTGDTLSYSIINGADTAGFSINPSTGEISISNRSLIDSSKTALTFIVQATDANGISNSAQVTITLSLIEDDDSTSPDQDEPENDKPKNRDDDDSNNKRGKHSINDIFHHGRSDHYFTSNNYFKHLKNLEHDDDKKHKSKSFNIEKHEDKSDKHSVRKLSDIFKEIEEITITQNQEYLSLIQLEDDKKNVEDTEKHHKKHKGISTDKQDTVVASMQKMGMSVLAGISIWAIKSASKKAFYTMKERNLH